MKNNKSKKVSIKNCTCYYYDNIIKFEDFGFHKIIRKSYENIFICNISYKILIDAKPLSIRFDKIDGFIRAYNGTRHLLLFGCENYDAIYNKISIA